VKVKPAPPRLVPDPSEVPMADPITDSAPEASVSPDEPPAQVPVDDLVEQDLLVEDVSIDGMCGVY
jgi:mycofactocin precursor